MYQSQGLTPVWVVAEAAAGEPTLEALGEAVELARPGAPGVVAVGPAGTREALAAAGAPRRGAGSCGSGRPGTRLRRRWAAPWGRGSARRAPPRRSCSSLTRATGSGSPRTSTVRLDAALAPEAVGVRRDADGGLEVTRPAYGDRLYATVRVPAGTAAVVTLRPGALGVGPPDRRLRP